MRPVVTGSLRVDQITVPIQGLSEHLNGLRLVQLSDLHYDGRGLSDRLLQQAIAASNEAEPDLVMLTGDYITNSTAPIHDLVLHLKGLQSRHGTYAILGNHDIAGKKWRAKVTQAMTGIGVNVLWNEIAYPLGQALPIVGLADYWSPDFQPEPLLSQLHPQTPRLVLSHNPDSAAVLQAWRVDLQLSGHTHGGQVVLPGLGNVSQYAPKIYARLPKPVQRRFPFLRVCARTMRHWEWAAGFHQVGTNQLYVNRGLGTYWPGRLFCPPEVTVMTLVRQAPSA